MYVKWSKINGGNIFATSAFALKLYPTLYPDLNCIRINSSL